jgi:hypothetical protein
VFFGDTFPCWLPVPEELGLRAVMVLLKNDTMLDAVEALVDNSCVVVVGPNWGVFGTRVPRFDTREVVGLVDGCMTAEVLALAADMTLHAVTATLTARRALPGWTSQKVLVSHARIGGVTQAHPRIHRYDRCAVDYQVGNIDPGAPRDVAIVLLAQGGTRHYRTAPATRAVEPLAVVNLGCEKNPIFHGGGLLPGVLDRGIRVLTPCVYAPQGKWAVRPTTYLEALLCKDVSETLAKLLVQFPAASDAVLRGFTPGKCLVAGFRALFHDWSGCGRAPVSGSRAHQWGSSDAPSCKEALVWGKI